MTKIDDLVDTGIEKLREFGQWLETDGLQTFDEWLLGREVPTDEAPERVIVTPPPKRPAAPPKSRIDLANSLAMALGHLPGTTAFKDMVNDATIVRCQRCGNRLSVAPVLAQRRQILETVSEWYREHGVNCGGVTVELSDGSTNRVNQVHAGRPGEPQP